MAMIKHEGRCLAKSHSLLIVIKLSNVFSNFPTKLISISYQSCRVIIGLTGIGLVINSTRDGKEKGYEFCKGGVFSALNNHVLSAQLFPVV